MHHKKWQRILAGFLAGVLCCSMLPMAAFAESTPNFTASGGIVIEEPTEEPAEQDEYVLPDNTAPPTEESVAETETATPESADNTQNGLSAEAQAFVDAVNALDRETSIAKANAWGLAKRAAAADSKNAELAAAFEQAIAEADKAAAPVYAADELYTTIPESERSNEIVIAAYTALAALIVAMQYAQENPVPPSNDDAGMSEKDAESILFADLPDVPTGSYIGRMGLPVATGETKISINGWNTDLGSEENAPRLNAAPLNEDNLTLIATKQTGKEYAVVPISVQVEYPANGSATVISLPDSVTLLSYASTADDPVAADETETENILHTNYKEVSAAALGFYVKASADFTATYTYTDRERTITKTLFVKVTDDSFTAQALSATGAVTYVVDGSSPSATSGKITSIQKVNGTWLIWFNGEEAYCCSHGLNGQPAGCPTYGYAYTSMLEPGQYTPGDHYANQVNIWGALGQLSLNMLPKTHAGSVEETIYATNTYSLADRKLLQYCYAHYDDTQMAIITAYPESAAAQIYLSSAKAAMGVASGASTLASATGYYTYIYTPPISGWQTVALIGPPVGEDGGGDIPPVPQEYYAGWSVNVQESASASFSVSMTVSVNKFANITHEKLTDAEITVSGNPANGALDGGSWSIDPASQIIRTVNGDGSVTFAYQGSVTKSASRSDSGSCKGSSQEDADSQASEAKENSANSLRGEAKADAQAQANAAANAAAEIARQFLVSETGVPHGFDTTESSNQTVTVQPNGSTTATIANQPWQALVRWEKQDAITGGRLTEDTEFTLYEWSVASGEYEISPNYRVARLADGTYTVRVTNSAYTDWAEGFVYYTQQNVGKFKIMEKTAAYGYTQAQPDTETPWAVEFEIDQQNKVVEYLDENADRNRPWGNQVIIYKTDSETGKQIAGDTVFSLYEWNQARGLYEISTNYAVVRAADGSYTVQCLHPDWTLTQYGRLYFEDTLCDTRENNINSDGTTSTHAKFYTDYELGNYPNSRAATNDGQFIIVEHTAPVGYYGDWTNIANPGATGSDLGKRAYYLRLTGDGSAIVLGNASYNADISTGDNGGAKVETAQGIVSVMISGTAKNADRTFTTDTTGLAANEDSYTITAGMDTLKNNRVLGELTLTKVDLDAMKYLAAGSNGNSTLEGAVYDLYAADDILHPDGVTGVVDYSNIVNAEGSPIWHTTIFDGNSWNGEYLPVLAKDHLVASTPIKDGKLVFANLYLGRYYLVERATGIVLPLDSAGKYVVNGVFPELNAKLERIGKNIPLAKNSADEYTDYVYRNHYSEVAISRNLAGVKTYDGYYKSYATGYLCDEVNHYKTLTYGSEAVYVNRDTQQSQDEVMKSGFSIQKLVSTTGQPSPALELAGAGFTVYRISNLSREASFTKNADGSYDIQSILTAYRKDKYDQNTKKYDFSKEQQAVATMYESDSAVVDAYNATLTGVGENTNGSGYGWRPTGTPAQYHLSEIFTNEIGVLRVEGLAYGQYLIVETTVPKDVFQADPFIVKVNGSTPQSEFCAPAGSVTTPSNSYQAYHVLDEELEGYLQLIKVDAETGKPVKLAKTAFKLYRITEHGKETIVQMNDPASGNALKKTTIFDTDEDGYLKTPEKLPLGKYRVVEVQGPNGYFNDTEYNVVFELTSDTVYEVNGNSYDDMDDYVITKEYINRETLGKITIRKTGEVLTGFEELFDPDVIDPAYTGEAAPGDFTYTERPLAGAEYTITATENIYTQDRQTDANGNRTLWYAKGDVVAVVTTGDGTADIAAFAPSRTEATYDFLSVIHDGTIGEVSVTLPLGSYHIEETKPPYGYVGTAQSYDVTLAWDKQTNEVVLAKTIVNRAEDGSDTTVNFEIIEESAAAAAEKETQVLSYHNEREKARVGVYKLNSLTGEYVAGAVFNLYATDDIYNADGKQVFAAGDLVAIGPETKADGYTYFNVDVPIRGQYYGVEGVHIPTASGFSSVTNSGNYTIVEIRPPQGYFLNATPMQVAFTYNGQALEILDGTCKNTPTSVLISKRELTGDDELPDATLTIQDKAGNTVREWVSTDTPTEIRGLHLNTVYTLVETRPADGYALASNIQFKLVQAVDENGNPINANEVYVLTGKDWLFFDHWMLMEDGMVVMRDDTTKVQISKQDITNHTELPGAHLTITNETGKVVADWVSTDKPHYIEKLPAGKYTLTEVQAPSGYDKTESIAFEVLPTSKLQTVTMYDRRTPDKPQDNPAPTPPPETPNNPTPTHTPTRSIPQTGDNSNLLLWAALAGVSLGVLIAIIVRRKCRNLPAEMNETAEPLDEDAGKQNNDEE